MILSFLPFSRLQDDIHHPTLTVYQTLKFALRTKTPGKRLPSVTRTQFVDQVMDVLLKMLGISHTKNTRKSIVSHLAQIHLE
jgi:ABC-type multidrug transport system ATPase subunit